MKPPEPSDTDTSDLRQALGQFATGVTIVTTLGENDEPIGVTANSFSSVSLEPPMVLWSLSKMARSKPQFIQAESFCVHVLTADQRSLSERFARAGADKFGGLEWSRGIDSVPLLPDYVARFQCRTISRYPAGDHIIFVGEILKFDSNENRPLVFHEGRYALAERRMLADAAVHIGDRRKAAEDRRPIPGKRRRYAD